MGSSSFCEIECVSPSQEGLQAKSCVDALGTKRLLRVDCPGEFILVPQPSADPNDPLNWSRSRKYWHVFTILFWCFVVNASGTWTGPAWATWVDELRTTYTDLNYAAGALLFMSAFGVLLSQPLALKYGRRLPCIMASVPVMVGLGIGQSMRDIGGFTAYSVLVGMGMGPTFTTNVLSIVDVTFQHQRGTWIGLYSLVILLGTFLPPVVAGYIVSSIGWKWCFTLLLILVGAAFVLLFFGSEETLFVRQQVPQPDRPTYQQKISLDCPHEPYSNEVYPKSTYWQRMAFIRRNHDICVGFWALTLSPFRLMALPAVVWASVMGSIGTFLMAVVFTTQASIFAVPPYNFGADAIGLMYFAVIIGMVLGAAWGGPFGDWIATILARRNGGISEPEHRLWAYLPVSWAAGGGIILYGVGASYGLHWAIPCVGLGLVGFALNSSTPLSMVYAIDCYDDLAGETIQLVNFLRSLISGGMTFIIQPWISYSGVRNTSIAIGLLVFVLNASSVGFQIWGKRMRMNTASRYEECVKKRKYE